MRRRQQQANEGTIGLAGGLVSAPAGTTVQDTEYWLVFERADGTVRRWMSFSSPEVAEGAIEDAERSLAHRPVRWGVRECVVQRSVGETQWRD